MFRSEEHTEVAVRATLMPILSFPEKVDRENNKDYNQVLLDVQRSLRRFPPGELTPVQGLVFHQVPPLL